MSFSFDRINGLVYLHVMLSTGIVYLLNLPSSLLQERQVYMYTQNVAVVAAAATSCRPTAAVSHKVPLAGLLLLRAMVVAPSDTNLALRPAVCEPSQRNTLT